MFSASFPKLDLTNYQSALSKWEGIKPIRGRSDQNTRPLYRRGDDSKTIRQLRNGSIALRYYQTDVVTFNPDDTVDLEPYASRSTCQFVWAALKGRDVYALWTDRNHPCPDKITQVGDKFYHTPDYVTVQFIPGDGWVMLGGDKPFEVPRLDQTTTRQALKDTGYDQFVLWLNTQIRLNLDPRKGDSWRRTAYDFSHREVSEYLVPGPSGWQELVRRMSRRTPLENDLASLRRAVYRYAGCVEVDEVPFFSSHYEMTSALNRMRKYG